MPLLSGKTSAEVCFPIKTGYLPRTGKLYNFYFSLYLQQVQFTGIRLRLNKIYLKNPNIYFVYWIGSFVVTKRSINIFSSQIILYIFMLISPFAIGIHIILRSVLTWYFLTKGIKSSCGIIPWEISLLLWEWLWHGHLYLIIANHFISYSIFRRCLNPRAREHKPGPCNEGPCRLVAALVTPSSRPPTPIDALNHIDWFAELQQAPISYHSHVLP